MTDDSTLLFRYATSRDEAAFAEIVRHHLPFVYAAALRRLGRDAHFAPDVAQHVFCTLARDAHRVARHPVLAGWLHTATRNAVSNVVRSESRRRRREEEAAHMQQIDSEPIPSTDWQKLGPVLDFALDRLKADEREAVLLRFFHGRTFGEIGTIVGSSEEAARKRTDRALAKLRELLRPQGIAATSVALAEILASQPACAAPPGLAASVTGAALSSGGAATGIATFITMTKLQTGIVAAIIVAGAIGLITQQRTIARLRGEAAALQAGSVNGAAANGTAGKRGSGGNDGMLRAQVGVADVGAPAPTPRGALRAETMAALGHGKVPERYFAFVGVLQKLTRENWREVLEAFNDERKRTGLGHPEVFEIFARHAGEVAGKDVVSYFLQRGWGGDANEAMMGWASKNPVEALQWLGREADVDMRHRVMGAAIRGLAFTEPDLAMRTLEEQPLSERAKYANEIVTAMLRTAGLDGVQQLVEGMIARAATNGGLKNEYIKQIFSDYASKRIGQWDGNKPLAEAVGWLTPHIGQPYLDHRVIAETAARLARKSPPEALQWLEGVNTTLLHSGDPSTAGYRVVLDTWRDKAGAQTVETWLQGQIAHPHYDHMAWQYAALVADQDPGKAQRWANTIKDPAIKAQAMQVLNRRPPRAKS